jgi:hypothetical protein
VPDVWSSALAKIVILRRVVPVCALLVVALLGLASPASAKADPHAKKTPLVHSHAQQLHSHAQHAAAIRHAKVRHAKVRHAKVQHAPQVRKQKPGHHPVRRHAAHAAAKTQRNRPAVASATSLAQRSTTVAATTRSAPTRAARRHARTTSSRKAAQPNSPPRVTLPRPGPVAVPQLVPPSVRTLLGDVPGLVVFSGRSGWLYGGSALFASLMILVGLVGWRPSRRSRR